MCKDKLKNHVESEAPCVSITTDIWTSIATEAYMMVTDQYIDASLKIRNCMLQTVSFPERQTGVNIADKLKEITERLEIFRYVLTVSHDQVSNKEAAMHILIEEYSWQSLPCSAHWLQLCILAGLSISAIDRIIAAVKKIVGHFSHVQCGSKSSSKQKTKSNLSSQFYQMNH